VGASGDDPIVLEGFTTADVAGVTLAGTNRKYRVVLTEPWKPWDDEPIRAFVAVIDEKLNRGRVPRALFDIRVVPVEP
jgi:hypothetical protein